MYRLQLSEAVNRLHVMSMVHQCLWYINVYDVLMSMVTLCLWCVNVYDTSMAYQCL